MLGEPACMYAKVKVIFGNFIYLVEMAANVLDRYIDIFEQEKKSPYLERFVFTDTHNQLDWVVFFSLFDQFVACQYYFNITHIECALLHATWNNIIIWFV